MNVRCPNCKNSFSLSRDYMSTAVAEAKAKKQKYHAISCPSCRKTVRVSISQMQRYLPRQQASGKEQQSSEDAG